MENHKKIIDTINEYCRRHPGAYETRPFGEYPICYKVMGKIFAQFNPQENFYKMTLKCVPEKAYLYRQLYPGIIVRGYHCPPVQQPHWNTIDLDSFSDQDLLFQMIDEAYETVINKLSKKDKEKLRSLSLLEFRDTNGEDPDFAMLCGKLDRALDEIVGIEYQRSKYDKFNQRDSIHDVVVAYHDGEPVACGAFKLFDDNHAEIKRVFVDPAHRHMGLGAELIRRLEAKAKMSGYRWCILETGRMLEAANALYKKAGYQMIPNYGQYEGMEDSVCMEHKI
ncbi:GNAT family N-acetyltransferase [Lacrimispora amygdalina]|uniref:GNAT family N-acetyltransferase n=1 Tax=Lacrimispora amygdalina TaxID=253257 RepID=UPI000BE41AF0|nr:GNAT family N-acetyltransferase [Lacrimispora amygdalina]